MGLSRRTRVAIVATHPIQYYAPWFSSLAQVENLEIKVFYLWEGGTANSYDSGFGKNIQWDIPLLEGYDHGFVPNTAANPATTSFFGMRNPTLIKTLTDWEPDALLLMCYNFASVMNLILRWPRRRTPMIFRGDSHRLDDIPESLPLHKHVKHYFRDILIRRIFARMDALLYVGQANKRYFQRYATGPRLHCSPHAIDNDRFARTDEALREDVRRWRSELGIHPDERVILFAGKFVEKKRPLDLVEAFAKAGIPHSVLLMLGNGPLEGKARQRAAALAPATGATAAPRILFAPFQNQQAMPRAYAAADVFVLPSSHHETWGLAVNEAMCQALPCIVSDKVGCAEDLITDGETGWTFPAGNIDALCQCIREALADDDRRKHMGQAAKTNVTNHYNYQRATEGLLRALESVTPATTTD